jgi:hypothetical protein
MTNAQILLGNPNDFRVKGFRDSRAAKGVYLNAATTATWDIRTLAGIAGGTSITSGTLTYVTSSNGEYVGGPSDTDISTLVEGTTYWVNILLVQGLVRVYANFSVVAVRRLGSSIVA